MYWFRWIAKFVFYPYLQHGPVSVPMRMCTSKHLGDYQCLGLFALALGALGSSFLGTWMWPDGTLANFIWNSPFDDKQAATVGLGVLAMGATFASWIYQSANRRIGVVDLFACEISSLCKVCLVTDFAENSVKRYKELGEMPTHVPSQLDSKESYTPIYDKSASDLQSLEREAVTSVTAFYTYRRTVMDYLRKALAATTGSAAQAAYEQMIYMQFLMLESARQAVEELTEFQPDRDETLVTIYCSELSLFAFLPAKYRGVAEADFKYQRLMLRMPKYDKAVAALVNRVESVDVDQLKNATTADTWRKAQATCTELATRYRRFWRDSQPDSPRGMPENLRKKSNAPYAGQMAPAE